VNNKLKKVYEEITTKLTMNRVKEPRMPFNWSINPYRGCTHGCSFCYARTTHSFLGLNADDSFQHHIFLKSNAAEALEEQLAKLSNKYRGDLGQVGQQVGLVAIGTATDPYQPVEAKAELTRECLKVLAKYRIPITITTRSPLILRDIDLLRHMNITSINVSINTLDSEITRNIEPATPFPLKRLEIVKELVSHGLPAGIFIAPILPYLTDSKDSLEELISTAKQHHAQFADPSVLRLNPEVKTWYLQTLKQHYPDLLPIYARLYPKRYSISIYNNIILQRVNTLLAKYHLSTKMPHRLDDAKLHRQVQVSIADVGQPAIEDVEEQLSFSF
jgi:DNA repair photolyase